MNTVIPVSSEVMGNIGSCASSTTSVLVKQGIFVNDFQNVLTNSCTGVVEKFDIWGITFFGGLSVLFGIALLVFLFVVIVSAIRI
jgi:hypothetical protein